MVWLKWAKEMIFFGKGERGRRWREVNQWIFGEKWDCREERKEGQNNNFKIMLLFNKLFIIFITIDLSHLYNILINPMAYNSGPLNSPKLRRTNVSATVKQYVLSVWSTKNMQSENKFLVGRVVQRVNMSHLYLVWMTWHFISLFHLSSTTLMN